jgi:hypothetical protein
MLFPFLFLPGETLSLSMDELAFSRVGRVHDLNATLHISGDFCTWVEFTFGLYEESRVFDSTASSLTSLSWKGVEICLVDFCYPRLFICTFRSISVHTVTPANNFKRTTIERSSKSYRSRSRPTGSKADLRNTFLSQFRSLPWVSSTTGKYSTSGIRNVGTIQGVLETLKYRYNSNKRFEIRRYPPATYTSVIIAL